MRRLVRKCTELLRKGVGVAGVEAFSVSRMGKQQARVPGEKGRKEVVKEEMMQIVSSNKAKIRDLKNRKKSIVVEFKKNKTREEYRRSMKKINSFGDKVRSEAKSKCDKKLKWLVKKYAKSEKFVVPQEVLEFKDLRIFQPSPGMVPEKGQGAVFV